MFNQSGPAGALGYERGFQDNLNYPQYSSTNPRAYSNSRQNLRIQKRLNPQDQYHNIQMGISNWTVDDGASSRTYSKTRSSSGQQQNRIGVPPPSMPPLDWISRQYMMGYANGVGKQGMSSRAQYDKQQQQQQQLAKIYRIKSHSTENLSISRATHSMYCTFSSILFFCCFLLFFGSIDLLASTKGIFIEQYETTQLSKS